MTPSINGSRNSKQAKVSISITLPSDLLRKIEDNRHGNRSQTFVYFIRAGLKAEGR